MAVNWNYIGLSVVMLAVLTVLVLYLPSMREIDSAILRSTKLALSPFPKYIPLFITSFGMAGKMLWPQITAGCVLVSHKMYLRAFMLILFTQIAYLLKDTIKEFVCRARPDGCELNGFSFPSGHCCATMCFYGIGIYLIHSHVKNNFWRNLLIALFGAWIFMMGLSRMWLGAHFLSDVLAGMFLGFLIVNVFIILDKSLS